MKKSELKDFNLGRTLKPLAIIIPLAIAGNIIYIALKSEPDIFHKLAKYQPAYLILAFILVFVPWFCHSFRMVLWSRVFKRNLKPLQAFKIAVASEIGSAITPTSSGGGYVKLGFLARYGFSAGEATLVMILGTIEDILFFAVSIPSAILATRAWSNPNVKIAFDNLISHLPILLGAAIVIALIYLVLYKRQRGTSLSADHRTGIFNRIKAAVKKFKEDFLISLKFAINKGKGTFAICAFLSGIGWCCRYAAISALVAGLGFPADPVLYFLLQWVVFTTMTAIPTPGAIGGAEISFAIVYSGIVPPGIIPILTVAWRFTTFYILIAVGAIFLTITGLSFSDDHLENKGIQVFEEIEA